MVDTHAKVVVVKGCSLVWLLLSAELYWGELIVEENQKEGLSLESTNRTNKANASRFHFSVGSFSIVVSSELKKETNVCFFRATLVLKKHRLLAVKYYTHVSFYHRIEQQFGTRF